MELHNYRASLTDDAKRNPVYDADTVRLTVDNGFGSTLRLGPCRLYGIDAWEMRGIEKVRGRAARDFLRKLLSDHPTFNIRTFKDRSSEKKGKYGRYLVTIILDDGTNVNELLVEKGHAVFHDYG